VESNIIGTGNEFANIITVGDGAHILNSARGNETYNVDNIGDSIVEAANAGTDRMLSSVSFDLRVLVSTRRN
jgi:hypothetical protein